MRTPLLKTVACCLLMFAVGASMSLFGQTSPFQGTDLGTVGHPGSITNNGAGSFYINGGGADIYGTSDGGFYYYTSVTGLVWEAKMRILSFTGPDTWSKVGIMVRRPSGIGSPPAADDPEIMDLVTTATGRNDVGTQHRPTRAVATQDHQMGIPTTYPNQWLRVTRTNTFFTCQYSPNGTTWINYATFSVFDTAGTAAGFDGTVWENPIDVGVAITAHNDTDTVGATALITNFAVNVFPVTPPTSAGIKTDIQGTTNVYAYAEANFRFVATNNATPTILYPMSYVWYKNGTAVATNSGTNFTFLTTPADNGAAIKCIANVNDPSYSSLTVTSAVLTLTANPGALAYTNGLKQEFFVVGDTPSVENGNVPLGVINLVKAVDIGNVGGQNYAQRLSGYFIAPATTNYTFFVASDDDSDVFLSTDISPLNKRLICQQTGFSIVDGWSTVAGGGGSVSQKRSDQWTPDGGATIPYATGIPLTGGQAYYIEIVNHNALGGANLAVTYKYVNDGDPADGTPSLLNATNNNIVAITWAGTNLSWSITPTNLTVFEGATANFSAKAVSDAEMAPTYQWYVNNAPFPGATGPTLSLPLVTLAQNGAQIQVISSLPEGGLSITSSVVTLTVNQAVLEVGFAKDERWDNVIRSQIENGSAGTPAYTMGVPGFEVSIDNPGNQSNFGRRVSGFFIPATTGSYVFFVNGDDDTDLFVSTDLNPANKRLVCQETTWSGPFTWLGVGAGSITQKRSDQWSPDGGVTTPWQSGIPLTAGTKYYVEMVFHQAGGGANCEATYKLNTDPDPVNGADTLFKGNRIAINAQRCNFVAFTQQPTNTTVDPFANATFTVAGATDSQLAAGLVRGNENLYTNNFIIYQWQKNGVDLPGATSPTLNYGPVTPSDNGVTFSCRIRALGYADNTFTPIWSNSVSATLTVNPAVFETGFVRVDWWTNNTTTRANVEAGAGVPPQFQYASPKFIAAQNSAGDNYVNRLMGFFIPPTTGDYVFFENCDDDGDLFLSTDSSPLNKRRIALEAGWSGTALGWSQTGGGGDSLAQRRSDQFTDPATGTQPYTAGIHLIAGQKYYMEAVHHEGGGGDYYAATYKLISDSDPANGTDSALQGTKIGYYVPRIASMAFLQQPGNQTATSGGNSVTFSALGTNSPSPSWIGGTGDPRSQFTGPTNFVLYQWYKNGTPIPGATGPTYTQIPILPSDNGAQFACGIRALGYADNSLNPIYSNSTPAVLTVITDTVPPTITYAATFQNTNQVPTQYIINITFNEWMDATTLSNAANYTISGVTITGVSVLSNHRTVQLLVTAPPTLPLSVTVNGVKDLSGNTITLNSSASINAEPLTFTDIGTPSVDPAYPSFAGVTASGGYIITAEGSDIWATQDGCNFAWELKTNDFDAVVRGVSQGHSSNFAKMGLMVREALDASSRTWSVVNDPAAADGIQATDGSGFGANNVEANRRDAVGGATASWKSVGNIVPTFPNAWVRIKRTGNILTALCSSNMVDWVTMGTYDSSTNVNGALSNVVYLGICTTAHNNDPVGGSPPFLYYNTAEFAGYTSSFVPLAPPAQITISRSGGNVNISWTPAGGHLESTPALNGPGKNWQNIGSSNPATVPIGSNAQFFRVVNP